MKRKAMDVKNEEEVEQGDEEGEEMNNKIIGLEERVKMMTGQLEEKVCQIANAEAPTILLMDGLIQIHQEVAEVVPAPPQAKQRRMGRRPGGESEEDEEADEDDGEPPIEKHSQI